jgi:hypothetical protein
VQQVGGASEAFFEAYANEVLPRFHRGTAADTRSAAGRAVT